MENNKSNNMTSVQSSKKYLFILVVLSVFGGIAFVMFSGMSYINNLENQVAERDSLIRKLTISDNLVKDYFDIRYDSIERTTTYSLKDTKKTHIIKTITKTIPNQIEPTFQQGDKTITLDELLRGYNQSNDQRSELINQNNDLKKKYNKLVDNWNVLLKKQAKAESENANLRSGLNMIKSSYGIFCDIKSDSTKHIISLINSPKIDSALLLLPYYRDRLQHNHKDNSWTILLPTKGEKVIINKATGKKNK